MKFLLILIYTVLVTIPVDCFFMSQACCLSQYGASTFINIIFSFGQGTSIKKLQSIKQIFVICDSIILIDKLIGLDFPNISNHFHIRISFLYEILT